MAQCDKATDSQISEFEMRRAEITAAACNWDVKEKKYLEAVLDQLSVMMAFYSYGNGDLCIEESSAWSTLSRDKIISAINKLTQSKLGVTLSGSRFPDVLWFELDMSEAMKEGTEVVVELGEKIRIAKSGANKIFKVEFSERQKMSTEQLIEVFDNAWKSGLEQWILNAEVIEAEEVERRLLDQHQPYIDSDEEHRTFRINNAEYISQLQPIGQAKYRLTQFWRVKSSDAPPKTLFVNFNSVEEIDRFRELAQSLSISPELLGMKLIRNFMDLHPGYAADVLKEFV